MASKSSHYRSIGAVLYSGRKKLQMPTSEEFSIQSPSQASNINSFATLVSPSPKPSTDDSSDTQGEDDVHHNEEETDRMSVSSESLFNVERKCMYMQLQLYSIYSYIGYLVADYVLFLIIINLIMYYGTELVKTIVEYNYMFAAYNILI